MLVILGIIAAVVWLSVASEAVNRHADGYPRTAVPGAISLNVAQPSTYYIYVEGVPATLSDLNITVTDPGGQTVAVTAMSTRSFYDHHGMFGHAVGRFGATEPGSYRLTASGPLTPYGDFAVGDDIANRMIPNLWGVASCWYSPSGQPSSFRPEPSCNVGRDGAFSPDPPRPFTGCGRSSSVSAPWCGAGRPAQTSARATGRIAKANG
ncbi:MAG: hypothetical protein WCC30_15870 [Candidatus Dormiibacterota bacterium]